MSILSHDREIADQRNKIALQRQYINRLRVQVEVVSRRLKEAGWTPPKHDEQEFAADDTRPEPKAPPPPTSTPQRLEDQLLLYADELKQLYRETVRLAKRLEQARNDSVKVVLTLVQAIEPALLAHGARVARYCDVATSHFQFDDRRRLTVRLAAIVHDLGRALLTKSENLASQSEFELAAQVLGKVQPLEEVASLVRQLGDIRRPIPLDVQILFIGNALDEALSEGTNVNQALQQMQNLIDEGFDAEVLQVFRAWSTPPAATAEPLVS